MSDHYRFGIVAGEKSGDILGASLISALRNYFPNAEFIGVGGSEMVALGCESLCPIDRLSVMGFVEPLRRLPELLTLKRKLRRRFLAERIDAFIGIDSPVFNLSLAKALKNKGIKTIHFVSPTIWAYRENRVFNIKKSIDLMLTLFPFEKDIYKKHKIKAECVGHPLADQLSFKDRSCNRRTQLGIPNDQTVVALLPGSRVDEVNRLAPMFFETALEALQKYPKLKFLVPFSNLETHLRLKSHMANLSIVAGEQFTLINDSHAALDASDFAFITSGTATLEALFLRKPMVICYKLAPISYLIGSRLIKVPYVGLPNILANEKIVPEYIQKEVTTTALLGELDEFMGGVKSFSELLIKYEEIHEDLRGGASEKAASEIFRLVSKI
jgi:lipid-A-disaccharide synthase